MSVYVQLARSLWNKELIAQSGRELPAFFELIRGMVPLEDTVTWRSLLDQLYEFILPQKSVESHLEKVTIPQVAGFITKEFQLYTDFLKHYPTHHRAILQAHMIALGKAAPSTLSSDPAPPAECRVGTSPSASSSSCAPAHQATQQQQNSARVLPLMPKAKPNVRPQQLQAPFTPRPPQPPSAGRSAAAVIRAEPPERTVTAPQRFAAPQPKRAMQPQQPVAPANPAPVQPRQAVAAPAVRAPAPVVQTPPPVAAPVQPWQTAAAPEPTARPRPAVAAPVPAVQAPAPVVQNPQHLTAPVQLRQPAPASQPPAPATPAPAPAKLLMRQRAASAPPTRVALPQAAAPSTQVAAPPSEPVKVLQQLPETAQPQQLPQTEQPPLAEDEAVLKDEALLRLLEDQVETDPYCALLGTSEEDDLVFQAAAEAAALCKTSVKEEAKMDCDAAEPEAKMDCHAAQPPKKAEKALPVDTRVPQTPKPGNFAPVTPPRRPVAPRQVGARSGQNHSSPSVATPAPPGKRSWQSADADHKADFTANKASRFVAGALSASRGGFNS